MVEQASPGDQISMSEGAVAFELAGRRYALPIEAVIQIIPMVKLTPLPQGHPALAGIMAFRGRPVPVVALRLYLGLPALPISVNTPIILIQVEQRKQGRIEHRTVGLIVDEVQGVIAVAQEHIAPVSATMPQALDTLPLLRGFLNTHEGVLLFLNLAQLFLVTPSLTSLEQAAPLIDAPTTPASEANRAAPVEPKLETIVTR